MGVARGAGGGAALEVRDAVLDEVLEVPGAATGLHPEGAGAADGLAEHGEDGWR